MELQQRPVACEGLEMPTEEVPPPAPAPATDEGRQEEERGWETIISQRNPLSGD